MIHQALIDVVKSQLGGGVSETEVREFLLRRGTSDEEIQEIFELISPDAPTLREIPLEPVEQTIPTLDPIIEPVVAEIPTPEPVVAAPIVADIPAQSVAHGVVRDIPPISPSVPFAMTNGTQPLVASIPASMTESLTVATSEAQPIEEKSKKKRIALITGLIGGIVILGASGWFAYSVFLASPEKVLDVMMLNLRDVRSGAFSGEVTLQTNALLDSLTSATSTRDSQFAPLFAIDGAVTIRAKASGAIDMIDSTNKKSYFISELSMDKWPMGDFILGAEYRNVAQRTYVQIKDVPDLGFFSLSFLKNSWFMLENTDVAAQLGTEERAALTEEQRGQLIDAWRENRFLLVNATLPAEDIEGVATRHYALTLDKEAFVSWIITANAIMQNPPTDQGSLAKQLDSLTINTFELWVGRRDRLPHKLLLEATMRDTSDASKTSAISIALTGKDFNKPVDVIVPEDAKSFEEVLQGIFGQMLGGQEAKVSSSTTPQVRNTQRKKDVTIIADAIKKNIAQNNGTFVCATGVLPQKATFIGKDGYDVEPCIRSITLPTLPKDPTKGTATITGYSLFYDAKTNKLTVRAPYAELGVKISITK
ncbi:MAG: hypothetical protein ACD_81C00218G0015 [uncultured bacterium]|uniref:Uncharacterized protein n=2 Tax=Candidatus Wolfeibacteriota TaxID=1752735 RepID=A0A0G1HB19_9BACT|nr:MAG: hypothetical protein ACD_81C00218G0015 [uncultured bacterium]KKR12777.1 MAG: hypothetical protein UT41_C0001G0321 [Candidatus Wolfebacteria bacterium GW2011_GWC2_39_22]KKT43708.1 MAG: hypothetical protein UW32_C0001G0300 [Candidatus Wolfebacteria bacterium GW2011_GWE2_44_13]HBI25561.1 hypothetical protein [Candidatus Wolfebacteria bacterium]